MMMQVPAQGLEETRLPAEAFMLREQIALLLHFGALNGLAKTHPPEGVTSVSPSLLIQTLVSSRNTLTDTPKNPGTP